MKTRIVIIFFILMAAFIVISARLFYWQILVSESFRGLSEKQTYSKVVLTSKRGSIFTRDGSPLVINQRAFHVFAQPQDVKNIDSTALMLSKETNIPVASIASKLSSPLQWVSIVDRMNEQNKIAVEKHNMPGIGFEEESMRYYPESSMAAQLLGFVGKNAKGEDAGYFGLEGYYDKQLKGRPGMLYQEQDSKGIPILFGNAQEYTAANGRDLYLTIDKTIQYIVERKLIDGVIKYGAKGGTVIVMDPQTGEILAMASYPSYDPARIEDYPVENLKNPAIASSYEPGSTFKVLIMAAALNENKIKPDTIYPETGPISIGKYLIKTWNQQYHGNITLAQILEYSSNVGMVFIQRQLGNDLLLRYIENLGFGKLTDIDLQEEASPLLRNRDSWGDIDFATASFGQGIAVTPLQMIQAVAAIANGGKLMKPYVVKSILTESGKQLNTQPVVQRVVFNKETTVQVSEMMALAVSNGETKHIKPAGFRIAGKTGTAQVAIAGHYDTEKTIASFIGFAPVENPKFIMLVTMQEPTTSIWGSETAAPIFFSIAKELFSYLNISSTE
jgi:cell division protein FtsI (penicillin-binding protein 3)